jgi:hypothetical protein
MFAARVVGFRENSFDEARMKPKVMMLNQFLDQSLDSGDVPGRFGAKSYAKSACHPQNDRLA